MEFGIITHDIRDNDEISLAAYRLLLILTRIFSFERAVKSYYFLLTQDADGRIGPENSKWVPFLSVLCNNRVLFLNNLSNISNTT